MRFLKLEIENFLSYADKQTLKLSKRGLVLIEGENLDDSSTTSNGAGKSSLFSALVWCLYGRTVNGLKGDDVVHLYTGHDCQVNLRMIGNDGIKYTITRYRKHRKMKNALELITEAGVRVTGVSTDETQEKINHLVGMDYTAFTGVLCGQGVLAPFSSLRDSDAKPIVEKVTGLTYYTELQKLAVKKLGGLEEWLTKHEQRLLMLEGAISTANANVMASSDRLVHAKKERSKRKQEVIGDLKVIKKGISELAKQIELAEVVASKVKQAEGEEAALQKYLKQKAQDNLRNTVMISQLRKELKDHESHRTNMGRLCRTCGARIDPKNVDKLIKRTQLLLSNAEKEAEKTSKTEAFVQHEMDQAVQKTKKVREDHIDLGFLRKQMASKKQMQNELLQRMSRKVDDTEKMLEGELKTAEAKLVKAESDLIKAKKEARINMRTIRKLKFWQKGFGNKGLKSMVLDSQLPLLNQKAAHYSRVLTDGNIQVSFRTQTLLKSGDETDRFGVDVFNKHGGRLYLANSGGERGKVDLIVGLAFLALLNQRSNSKLNVVFLDEPFENLDPAGFDRVLTLLVEEMDQYESVFVITHRQELKDYFSNEITIVKQGKKSRIVDR